MKTHFVINSYYDEQREKQSLYSLPIDTAGKYYRVRATLVKDSFITQDRNEHFEGGTHEATFSRGHSSLTGGTISKNWVSYEIYGYYLSTDAR